MADVLWASGTPRSGFGVDVRTRRGAIVLVVLAGTIVGFVATDPSETVRAIAASGDALARLLRFMAMVKAALAFAAVGTIVWRMALPATAARFALYAAAACVTAAGPGLIWGLVHVGLGAALLHGGLAACALLLWRDSEIRTRLSELVAIRRRDL